MNKNPAADKTPIKDYLANVTLSSLCDEGYVAPPKFVTGRIEEEISGKCGCTPELLGDGRFGRPLEFEVSSISADPKTFAGETIAEIERISGELEKAGAKKFQIAFRNADCEPNLFRDKVFVKVRYVT